MKLLLDTNIVIWVMGKAGRIRPSVRDILAEEENQLFVSAASLVEIAAKVARGRLVFDDEMLKRLGEIVTWLPVSAFHAWAISRLPDVHTDPLDRLLVVQAIEEGMTLVTGDHALANYDVPIILT